MEGIQLEREKLTPLKNMADWVIDTTALNVHQLKDVIQRAYATEGILKRLLIYVTSFGYRYGIPVDADIVFDVRFLPNPYFVEDLKRRGAYPEMELLRLEKAYRTWKGDLSTDYSLSEGGLDRFVKFDKPQDFPGKAALLSERQRGGRKRFAVLTVDAGEADAPPMSTIWHEGRVVGEATSGGWGYRVGTSIAIAMLRADLAVPGTAVEVEIYGERRPALVRGDGPLWDPENARLRA